ncbi:unnamed protein product [Angiostrongylus costaricensis]|uniref:C2 domain-containing protein n=1 Tax=Angiostrongylus costaricensis TaxID=334426 RepID=A0A0R3PK14_ANGCS|nr:unnamed protein product [Angiostrongylus costaricensis]
MKEDVARRNGYFSSGNEWTNELLAWLFSNFLKVPAPLEAWIKSLNDAAKKVNKPSECEVIFDGFGDHSHVKTPPKLNNIRVEHGPREHLTLKTNVHLPCVCLKVVSSQRTPERLLVSNFDVNIVDLRGEIECRFACIANQLFLMGCFNGTPEMDIELTSTDSNAQTHVSLGLVEEKIRRCLLSAVTNINLSESVTSNPDEFPSNTIPCAPLTDAKRLSGEYTTVQAHVPEIFKKFNDSHLMSPVVNLKNESNKLRVKVIKATRLGRGTEVHQPFVVIEVDEPAQKFTTTNALNTLPFWEESFDFELTSASEEILFEVYDGSAKISSEDDKNFLGLAIVNLEEIKKSGEHVHNLKLQGRPYRKDEVHGELTVTFDFYYSPKTLTAGKLVDTLRIRNSNGSEFRETITTQRRAVYDPHDHYGNPEIMPTKTTTVVLKAVSQQLKDRPAIQSVHGSMENAVEPTIQHILDQQFRNTTSTTNEIQVSTILYSTQGNGRHLLSTRWPIKRNIPGRQKRTEQEREKRERSFFGELRDRISGRPRMVLYHRSKSVDVHEADIEEAVSLPPSRDASRTRVSGPRYHESQSVGGKSGESSSSLYTHSTLVLELDHEGEKKYFLIPPSMMAEPATIKLMRHGRKLHIYNEHTFVAVKIRGGLNCHVCQQRIKSSFMKQAYQCRDCKLVCHKSCHYKTDAFCPHSKVSKLQIAKDVDWEHFLNHYQFEEFISIDGV